MSSSLKNNKNDYQHSISSTSNANFINIRRFEQARLKKALGAVSIPGSISKKKDFSFFLAQGKNPTAMQVKIKKYSSKGLSYHLSHCGK